MLSDADDLAVAEPPLDVGDVVGRNRRRDRGDGFEPESCSIPACCGARCDVERAMNVPLTELLHVETIESRWPGRNSAYGAPGWPGKWRRRESNPRPRTHRSEPLQA